MSILLTDDVSITIEPGMILDSTPRLTLDGWLYLYPESVYSQQETIESYLARTTGSEDGFDSLFDRIRQDEWRFDKTTLLLTGVKFTTTLHDSELPAAWLEVERVTGLPRLTAPQGFRLPGTDYLPNACGDVSGLYFASFNDAARAATGERLTLQIARDLRLMLVNNRLAGWLLTNPANYITTDWITPGQVQSSDTLKTLLGEYYRLIGGSSLDAMIDRDESHYQQMMHLREKIAWADSEGPGKKALRKVIEAYIRNYYDREFD